MTTPIYITHVTVIDTESDKEDRDRTVIISDDRISAVRDSKDLKPPKGAKVFEGTNRYLIPGLWDMHVHMRGSMVSTASFDERRNLMQASVVSGRASAIFDS